MLLENWKKLAIKHSIKWIDTLNFVNKPQISCEGLLIFLIKKMMKSFHSAYVIASMQASKATIVELSSTIPFKLFKSICPKQMYWIVFFIKLQAVFKKRIQHTCFPVNIDKFLRTPIFSKKNYTENFAIIFEKHQKASNHSCSQTIHNHCSWYLNYFFRITITIITRWNQ